MVKRTRVLADDDQDPEEDELEYAPRAWKEEKQADSKRKLPFKTETGAVIKRPVERKPKKPVEKKEQGEEEEEEVEEEDEPQDDGSELDADAQLSQDDALMLIAELANKILSNEANSVKPAGVTTNSNGVTVAPEKSALERLIKLSNSRDWMVRKSAMLSLLAVFRDTLPTEKVRELTQKELSAKTTMETRVQRAYEKALMTGYRLYLAALFLGVSRAPWERSSGPSKRDPLAPKVARVAMYCLCQLMDARPNFNFFDDILKRVIPRTSSPDAKTARICCEGLAKAVADDISLECALAVVRSLGRIYERKSNISCQALESLSTLKLTLDLKDERRLDLIEKAKKQRRDKRRKLGMDLAKMLEDTDVTATRNHEAFQRQIEIIRELFTLYLRILTDASEDELKLRRRLTVQALRGAARLVTLVNIEFVHGLVQILTGFFASSSSLSGREMNLDVALQTCETGLHAMAILGKPELRTKTTASEETAFTKLLLRCVSQLSANENASLHTAAIVRCVTLLFLKRRETDVRAVADFAVRLISAATRVSAHFSLALMAIQRNLLERYPSAKDIVLGSGKQVEEEACGPMVPIAFSADQTNLQQARAGWELDLLAQSHYHVAVRKFADETRMGRANFNDNPLELMALHHPLDGELFYPGVPGSGGGNRKPKAVPKDTHNGDHQNKNRGSSGRTTGGTQRPTQNKNKQNKPKARHNQKNKRGGKH